MATGRRVFLAAVLLIGAAIVEAFFGADAEAAPWRKSLSTFRELRRTTHVIVIFRRKAVPSGWVDPRPETAGRL
jgi:hypothetical protein